MVYPRVHQKTATLRIYPPRFNPVEVFRNGAHIDNCRSVTSVTVERSRQLARDGWQASNQHPNT